MLLTSGRRKSHTKSGLINGAVCVSVRAVNASISISGLMRLTACLPLPSGPPPLILPFDRFPTGHLPPYTELPYRSPALQRVTYR